MGALQEIKAVVCGCIHRETIINLNNQVIKDSAGGGLAYAAAAFKLWSANPGLVARISNDTPHEMVIPFDQKGMNITGIHRNPGNHEMRAFYKVLDQNRYDSENPIKYFGAAGEEFPKMLLGYSEPPFQFEKRNIPSPITLLPEHIPVNYLDCSSFLFCETDYCSLSVLPPYLRMSGVKNILVKPSRGIMTPNFWSDLPTLVRGCTGLICTANEAINLFLGRTDHLHEIIESIAGFGLDFVVVTCGSEGQHLFLRYNLTHWHIPAYPVKVIDPIHASDCFAGAFLAGYLKCLDPLMACLFGNVATSFKMEGSGAFYLLDALPELSKARFDILKEKVNKI